MEHDGEKPEEPIKWFRPDMEFDFFTQLMMAPEERTENESLIDLYSPEATELMQKLNDDEETAQIRDHALLYTALMHNAWLAFRRKAYQKTLQIMSEKAGFTIPPKDEGESKQHYGERFIRENNSELPPDESIVRWKQLAQSMTFQAIQIQRNAVHGICPVTRDAYQEKDTSGNVISYDTPHKTPKEASSRCTFTFHTLPEGNT